MDNDIKQIVKNLYKRARLNGGIEYLYTLLRVGGIESFDKDPIIVVRDELNKINDNIEDYKELCSKYLRIVEPYELIYNLISCAKGLNYNCAPFLKHSSSNPYQIVKPSSHEIFNSLIKNAENSKVRGLIKFFRNFYSNEIIIDLDTKYISNKSEGIKKYWQLLKKFLIELINVYFNERLSYRNVQKYFKLKDYEVLELLVNNDYGLYGFKMHFSSGNNALYKREDKSTDCVNVNPKPPIGFNVGFIDDLKREWRVGDKKLYQIGIPGRYNKFGEWKPIIYPGDVDKIENEIKKITENSDIQGILFYIYCTCHHVIEFFVKTPVDLPIKKYLNIGSKFHLWKCPKIDDLSDQSLIYDGWFDLDRIDPDYIEAALEYINLGVNRIGFIYGKPVHWDIKYKKSIPLSGYAKLKKNDLNLLRRFLEDFPDTEDSFYLDYAIDWFNHGRLSRNPFISFLCYYISIESISIALTEGKAKLGVNYHIPDRIKSKEERKKCIGYYSKKYLKTKPVLFISEAYFDCIVGLRRKLQAITELIFGKDHHYLELFFKKRDGHSLYSIRQEIAHGKLSLLDRSHAKLVKSRLPEIEKISEEFLLRIIFKLKSKQKIPKWSKQYHQTVYTNDPRTLLFAGNEDILPTKDWRIRSEWCN